MRLHLLKIEACRRCFFEQMAGKVVRVVGHPRWVVNNAVAILVVELRYVLAQVSMANACKERDRAGFLRSGSA